jgi:hypothetical protein
VSDLPSFDQIPDPIPEDQRPRAANSGKGPVVPASEVRPSQPAPRRLDGVSPNRAQTRRRRWIALALSGAWLGTHLAVYGVRQDLMALPAAYVAVQVGLPFVFAVASLSVALSPGRLGLGMSLGAIATVGLLGPVSFWLSALGMPKPAGLPGNSGLLSALVCFDITLLWAALPLVAAAFSLRRMFASGAAWRSALVGAAAGLFSGAVMNLHCPNVDPLHMVLGHGVPILIGGLVGAFLLSRWLKA